MKARLLPLFFALAAAFSLAQNAAAAGKLVKFAGTYDGTYGSSGAILTYIGSFSGPTTAKVKTTQAGSGAKVTLSGENTANFGGGSYSATLDFKKNGSCTTTAVVPGLVNVAGSGTWKLKGSKITFKFTADTGLGTVNATGSIQVGGKTLKIASTGTASTIFGTGQGKYTFQGTK